MEDGSSFGQEDWITLGAIGLLLVLSGFFSASETAITGASRPRMHQRARRGDRRAGMVNRLHARMEKVIGAILLGNNLVNILASSLATSVMITLFGDAGVAYATLAMTLLVLIFAEVLPKTYAINNADGMARGVAPILQPLVLVLAPITGAVQFIVRMTLRVFGVRIRTVVSRELLEEELRGAIELHGSSGAEVQEERAMLRSILDLGDVWVSEIMNHRRNLVTIDADDDPEAIVDQALGSPYTRLPVWREAPDNIVGVVHAKDLLRALRDAERRGRLFDFDVAAVATPPWFIPENTTLLQQLQAFRVRREHFALVVDEYGVLQGVVTLEDIIEEIVGEISDEHDKPLLGVRPTGDGSYIVHGTVTIRDLNRQFDWVLPDEEAATIAGLLLHEARILPKAGQTFTFHGFRFEVLQRQRNQITLLRLTPPQDPPEAE